MPKESAEQDSNKVAETEPLPNNENKVAEGEVKTKPEESSSEVPVAEVESLADGETEEAKPIDEEKKTKI